jgi:hypothetical protein
MSRPVLHVKARSLNWLDLAFRRIRPAVPFGHPNRLEIETEGIE